RSLHRPELHACAVQVTVPAIGHACHAVLKSARKFQMRYPLAWYLTWTTYGTWLHGDARGSNSRSGYVPPNPTIEAQERRLLTGEPVILSDTHRTVVKDAIVKECETQKWPVHAINVRTNHVRIVLSANRDGKFSRAHLKAIASAAHSDHEHLPIAGSDGRRKWWTEKGNIVEVETENDLDAVVVYVRELQ